VRNNVYFYRKDSPPSHSLDIAKIQV